MIKSMNQLNKSIRKRKQLSGNAAIHKQYKLSDLDINFINNYPKTINENGCWIPINKADSNGYVRIKVELIPFVFHRLSMCIAQNLNYNDKSFDTRHSKDCDHACFNYNHLQSGTIKDNAQDSISHGTHWEVAKKVCPKCDGEFKIRTIKSGRDKGKKARYCPLCANDWHKK